MNALLTPSPSIQLWRRDAQGTLRLVEVSPDMYRDKDAFKEALDFYHEQGYQSMDDLKASEGCASHLRAWGAQKRK